MENHENLQQIAELLKIWTKNRQNLQKYAEHFKKNIQKYIHEKSLVIPKNLQKT